MNANPVVIVTGASRGLGMATSLWLAKAGAFVALMARTRKDLQQVLEQIHRLGGRGMTLTVDVANPEQCRQAVDEVLQTTDGIDALINNAGELAPLATIARSEPNQWRENIRVNLVGPFQLIQSALPALRQSNGRVVNVSSGAAKNPTKAWSAYCAAKAGLTHFTAVLALEEPAVTALAVRPGVVDTQMQRLIRHDGHRHMMPDKVAFFQQLKDTGQLEPPDIPARSIAWLALRAPHGWTGRFLDYDQAEIAGPAEAFFNPS